MKFVGVPNGGNNDEPTGEPFLHGEEWKQRYRRIQTHGTAFEGTEGWVHIDRGGINLQPQELDKLDPDDFRIKLGRSNGHARNFLDCVKTRAESVSSIDAALASETLCHVADIAVRLGRKLTFDLAEERFVNDEAANQRLKARPQRAGWNP
jgi:hypothetical protein